MAALNIGSLGVGGTEGLGGSKEWGLQRHQHRVTAVGNQGSGPV